MAVIRCRIYCHTLTTRLPLIINTDTFATTSCATRTRDPDEMSTETRAPSLHPILSSQSMILPALSLFLSRSTGGIEVQSIDDGSIGRSFEPNEFATSPPVHELWLVVLSHSLHITATDPNWVTISQVFATIREFWESPVPRNWEGYSSCRRRARKDRISREGKLKVEQEEKEEGNTWQFTWWESLEVARKEGKNGHGRWEEPKIDGMGNVRLVLRGFEV